MNFLGITDVEIISASSLNISPEAKAQSLARARADIKALAVTVSQQDEIAYAKSA